MTAIKVGKLKWICLVEVMVCVVVQNPTREEIKELIHVSRNSIWPQLAKIEAHCRIEMTLDK